MAKLREPEFTEALFQQYQSDGWKFLQNLNQAKQDENVGILVASPKPVLMMTAFYVVFVCLIGPLMMRNREAFQLKTPIRFYNLIMVFLAAWLFYQLSDAVGSVKSMFDPKLMFTLSDTCASKIYRISCMILAVRLSEYLDTIFFTLRKKTNQITFLHVFHHAFVPIYAYWVLRTAPLRFNVFIIMINSFIHILMYFYYFLATFQTLPTSDSRKTKSRPSFIMATVNKLLMFKRYMTQLQILQFVALGAYSIYGAAVSREANIPMTYIISNSLLAFGFLSLFVHFYLQAYKINAKTKQT